jgi:putative colanic acid biosynthesis acetyltransferase WcaF
MCGARRSCGCLARRLGGERHFHPAAKVWAPWNLVCEDCCTLADGAEIYNPSSIYLELHCIISQQAYICGATHDYNDPEFPMISHTIRLGAYRGSVRVRRWGPVFTLVPVRS